jgi:nucleoside-diphosphate-sugar epimerase
MTFTLVTGANGFIGRHLCSTLLTHNHEVRALVRSSQRPMPGVTYITGELTDQTVLSSALLNVDCVVHLAGRAHQLNDTSTSPLEDFRLVNRDATVAFAKQCIAAGVRRFIFISSIGVNGNETVGTPFTEASVPAPHAPYAVSKWEAEVELQKLFSDSPAELVIIRPPLVYAANAPGNFKRLLKLVSLGAPLPFGTVHNARSMISLENLTDIIRLCTVHPKAAGEVFLVSDGKDLSLPEILRCLAQGMVKPSRLVPVPVWLMMACAGVVGKKAMVNQLCGSLVVDSTKTRALLGWVPLESPEDALIAAGRDYTVNKSAGSR